MLSALGGLEELTLFDGSLVFDSEKVSLVERAVGEIPKISSWRKGASTRLGLYRIALQSSRRKVFDDYLEDYLATIGIPVAFKRPDFLAQGDLALITEGDVDQLDLAALSERGVNLILTSSAVERLADAGAGNLGSSLLGLDKRHPLRARVTDGLAFVEKGRGHARGHRIPQGFPVGPLVNLEEGDALLYVYDGTGNWPVLTRKRTKSTIYLTGFTKYVPYLVSAFPEIVRQYLRDIVGVHTGVWIESIGSTLTDLVFLLEGNRATLMNLRNYSQRFRLNVRGKCRNRREDR